MVSRTRNRPSLGLTQLICLCAVIAFKTDKPCLAQVLSRPSTASDNRRLETPADNVVRKERRFIREVLEPELILRVETAKTKILRTSYPIARVAIGDPAIVDINEFDAMEIEVRGLDPGETTLTLWFSDEQKRTHVLRYLVKVDASARHRYQRVARWQDEINEAFPNSQVQLIPVRDKLLVRGEARDAEVAEKIMALLGAQNNRTANYGGGDRRVIGRAFDNAMGDQTLGRSDFRVINMLRIPGVQQVMLKVRVAELSRSSGRDLGADVRSVFSNVAVNTLAEGIEDFTAILSGEDVRFFIRAVTANGYGKILAEPTLVTISGQSARFLSGGEFPVPTAVGIDGVNAATTEFRGFGTELEFTPTVLDKDLIRLRIAPSFSSLNGDAAVNGIPGLDRRMVETTVDLREGQWLAVAGLIHDQQAGARSKLPYLSRLPIVGGLFGTQQTTRQETELVVLVSPQLVHPIERDEVPLLLPGMEVTDPTDDDFFLRNMTEGFAGADYRSTVHPAIEAHQLTVTRLACWNPRRSLKCFAGCQGDCERTGAQVPAPIVHIQDAYLLGHHGFSK